MKFNLNSALEQAKQSFQGKATNLIDQLKAVSLFRRAGGLPPTVSSTPDPWVEKGWTKAGEGYYRPSSGGSGYTFVDKQKIPVETLSKLQSMPILIASPTPDKTIEQSYKEFSDTPIAKNATNYTPVYADYIRQGLRKYAEGQARGTRLPIEEYVPLFDQAAQKYPIFKKYPWLLPAISILETSGGLSEGINPGGTYENNPLSWAARVQKAGGYSPSSWEQSINDAITGIGGDYTDRPEGSARARTAGYYESFRQSQDLRDFANIYEPSGNNAGYYGNLMDLQNLFGQFQ